MIFRETRSPRDYGLPSMAVRIAAALLVVGALLAIPVTSEAATAPGVNPACGSNYAAQVAYITNVYGNAGLIQVSYSPCTRNVWAYIQSYYPPCQANGEFCGFAYIHRNSDGATLMCSIPVGATTCNTGQLYDANVTSYAYGYIAWAVNQPLAYGQTGNW